jgi:hypothetical protein
VLGAPYQGRLFFPTVGRCGSVGRRLASRDQRTEQHDREHHHARAERGDAARPGLAQPCGADQRGEQDLRGLHCLRRGKRDRIAAHQAGRAEKEHGSDDAGAQRDAAGESHLRQRRRTHPPLRVREHRQPQRQAGERETEHALRRVKLDARAFQVQQQPAVAERIRERADRDAAERDPRVAIEPATGLRRLHHQHARERDQPADQRRTRNAPARVAVQQRRAEHSRHHGELECAGDQPSRAARRRIAQRDVEQHEADAAPAQPRARMRAHRRPQRHPAPAHQRQHQRHRPQVAQRCGPRPVPAVERGGAVEHVGRGEEQRGQQRQCDGAERDTRLASHPRRRIGMPATGTCTSSTPPRRIGAPGCGPQACA